MRRVELLTVVVVTALFFVTIVEGRSFYISALTGDDSRSVLQAQNPNTPWLSLLGIRRAITGGLRLVGGDSLLFRRGGLYRGSFTVEAVASADQPISITAYGSSTDSDPHLRGTTLIEPRSWSLFVSIKLSS